MRRSGSQLLSWAKVYVQPITTVRAATGASIHQQRSHFHSSAALNADIPYLLADIGEGITECQIISWSVKEGDYVQEFDTICEVQSDKASVEITSRFEGKVTSLLYQEGDVAVVGKALLNMDVPDTNEPAGGDSPQNSSSETITEFGLEEPEAPSKQAKSTTSVVRSEEKDEVLLTPAVRHMLKEANVSPSEVKGTGRQGRITKDDVQRHLHSLTVTNASSTIPSIERPQRENAIKASDADQSLTLSNTEAAMFKTMTKSLTIPHFLFSHQIDVTSLNRFRQSMTASKILRDLSSTQGLSEPPKISVLPYLIKALSYTLTAFPKLNSHLQVADDVAETRLILKSRHNFGIAIDTPQGLVVPVIHDVQRHSIISLAAELSRLKDLAHSGRLKPADFQGATFTVSNVGALGGDVVAPIIVSPMVGILGIGAMRSRSAAQDGEGQQFDRQQQEQQITLSWSADHRIIDGATVAKAARLLESLVKDVSRFSLVAR